MFLSVCACYISALSLWMGAWNSADPAHPVPFVADNTQKLAGGALASLAAYALFRSLAAPVLVIATICHTTAAAYDAFDGMVPDAIWFTTALGRVLLVICGVEGAPDANSMLMTVVLCAGLLGVSRLGSDRQVGGADLGAFLCAGLLLCKLQFMVYTATAGGLALVAGVLGVSTVRFLPFCLCALIAIVLFQI